jgi:hypothetical protein
MRSYEELKKESVKANKLIAKGKYKGILYFKWWLAWNKCAFKNWLKKYPCFEVSEKIRHSQEKGFEVIGFRVKKMYKMINNVGVNHGKH